jgi:hypothetical protein
VEPVDEVVAEIPPTIVDEPTPAPVEDEPEAAPSVESATVATETSAQPVKTRQRRPRRRPTASIEQPSIETAPESEPVVEPIIEASQPEETPVEATAAEDRGGSEDAEPPGPDSAESSTEDAGVTDLPDSVIAAALREIITFENDHPGAATDPATWRRRFRQAVERAGGPRLDARALSQLIRSRLLPRRLIEPTGPAESGRKLRPYQIRRNHPNVIALVGRRETASNGSEG